jgi:uncharacterized protein (DUF2267 family)
LAFPRQIPDEAYEGVSEPLARDNTPSGGEIMTTGIAGFDTTINKTKVWIHDVKDELSLDDDQQAYVALRAVLHALRDRLTVEEAVQFGAQLPILLRGVYYDQWRPVGKPLKIRHLEEFLGLVNKGITQQMNPALADPQRIAKGVFKVIEKYVSAGEMEDVRRSFPKDLQPLWPERAEA